MHGPPLQHVQPASQQHASQPQSGPQQPLPDAIACAASWQQAASVVGALHVHGSHAHTGPQQSQHAAVAPASIAGMDIIKRKRAESMGMLLVRRETNKPDSKKGPAAMVD